MMGIVNLFADMTYEGASSINGPFLGMLGASAAAIGVISGVGEFLGYSPSLVQAYVAAESLVMVEPSQFGIHDEQAHRPGHGYEVMLLSGFIALIGIGLAWLMHLHDRARAERVAAGVAPLTRLLEAKYFVDEVYQAVIVEPLRSLGRAFFWVDRMLIDGVVGAMGWVPQLSGTALKLTVQRGYLQGYAAAMLFGVVVILLIIFL